VARLKMTSCLGWWKSPHTHHPEQKAIQCHCLTPSPMSRAPDTRCPTFHRSPPTTSHRSKNASRPARCRLSASAAPTPHPRGHRRRTHPTAAPQHPTPDHQRPADAATNGGAVLTSSPCRTVLPHARTASDGSEWRSDSPCQPSGQGKARTMRSASLTARSVTGVSEPSRTSSSSR